MPRPPGRRPFRPLPPGRPRPSSTRSASTRRAPTAPCWSNGRSGPRARCRRTRLEIAFAIAGSRPPGNAQRRRRVARAAGAQPRGARASRPVRLGRRRPPPPAGRCLDARATSACVADGRRAVLMDWPATGHRRVRRQPRAPTAPSDVRAFVAVDEALRAAGLSAPEIFAADLAGRLAADRRFRRRGRRSRRRAGSRTLRRRDRRAGARSMRRRGPTCCRCRRWQPSSARAFAARRSRPRSRCSPTGIVPHVAGAAARRRGGADFTDIWRGAVRARSRRPRRAGCSSTSSRRTSSGCPSATGIARIGFIDFQDMFVGPAAYDVASLCQDARVTVPPGLETALRDRYVALRRGARSGLRRGGLRARPMPSRRGRATSRISAFSRASPPPATGSISATCQRLGAYLARTLAIRFFPLRLWYERHLPSD